MACKFVEVFVGVVVHNHVFEDVYFGCAYKHIAYKLKLDDGFAHADYMDAEGHQPYDYTEELAVGNRRPLHLYFLLAIVFDAVRTRRMRHKIDGNRHVLVVTPNLNLF